MCQNGNRRVVYSCASPATKLGQSLPQIEVATERSEPLVWEGPSGVGHERFPEEVSSAADGIVVKATELPVPKTLVVLRGLEAERIQPHSTTPAIACRRLCPLQQVSAQPFASGLI